MLEVSGLRTGYGAAQAIADLTFEIADGGGVALLGRNGAGKTTTFKAVMGLLPVWSGDIRFDGQRLNGLAPDAIARLGLGYVPEDRRVFADLSVTENLVTGAKPGVDGKTAWTEDRVFDLFPEIARRRTAPAGTLSGGERQMLAIARALMGNPRLLFLDEPAEGLAPVVVDRLAATLAGLRDAGMAMLVSEQNPALARRLADGVLVLETGRMRYSGDFSSFDRDSAAIQGYLGI